MTSGRPTMLTSSWKVSIPLLIDDEHLSIQGEGMQPINIPSRLGLFVSTCHLFKILHEILSNFYAGDSDAGASKLKDSDQHRGNMLADVLSYNRRLDKFHDAIPAYLHVTTSTRVPALEKNNCVNLQQQ